MSPSTTLVNGSVPLSYALLFRLVLFHFVSFILLSRLPSQGPSVVWTFILKGQCVRFLEDITDSDRQVPTTLNVRVPWETRSVHTDEECCRIRPHRRG